MVSWLNFGVLIAASVIFTIFYVKSVRPAALEKRIGPAAYQRCAFYRMISSVFMMIAAVTYIVYHWYPLPLPLPKSFPWPWWVSAAIAVLIAVPSSYLLFRGIKDAGEETMLPKREHTMYGGIYTRIRHPQAVGELPLWGVFAFILESPFLVLFSIFYIPVWYYFCIAEERDLIIRYGSVYEEYRRNTGFWLPKRRNKRHRELQDD